ncbi:MAG: NAD-dependent epimerase/dehydratase family protein [Turicibacter sp.]|nr:NAD-dependent epimerase/dehydratase family protein [Turicibacter sp.]
MNIVITGSGGFIGKNLISWLKNIMPTDNIICLDRNAHLAEVENADFVFHLAGVNRPQTELEFQEGNVDFTERLLSHCKNGKKPPILFTSSTQAALNNPYGRSKKTAEDMIFAYGKTGSPAYVYRLPGIFGKFAKPNYNTVVATFCHNIAHNLPITINNPNTELNLAYIDDCCQSFANILKGGVEQGFCEVQPVYSVKLGKLAEIIQSFGENREKGELPDLSDGLVRKLYSTYFSYLPKFSYPLVNHSDERGSFSEFIKLNAMGQVSVNVTKPGYTKGNHWHHSKVEKFLTVSGKGVVRFRKIGDDAIQKYAVDGARLEVVDIPPGYTHSLVNTGEVDLITIIWVNEVFDRNRPDSIYEDVGI